MRVQGDGALYGADRTSEILLSAERVDGPGELSAYLTESFGNPAVSFDSGDGFDPASGYRDDTTRLPPAAHSHMTWAFDEPGVYRLTVTAAIAVEPDEPAVDVGGNVITFAVGVDPHSVPGMEDAVVLEPRPHRPSPSTSTVARSPSSPIRDRSRRRARPPLR